MNLDEIRNALGPAPRGDKPRRLVICHPDLVAEMQRMVVHDLGHRDVLVKPSRHLPVDTAYVMDGNVLLSGRGDL